MAPWSARKRTCSRSEARSPAQAPQPPSRGPRPARPRHEREEGPRRPRPRRGTAAPRTGHRPPGQRRGMPTGPPPRQRPLWGANRPCAGRASAPPRGLAADAGPPAPAAPCPSAPRTQGGAAAGPFPARRGSARNSHRPPRQRRGHVRRAATKAAPAWEANRPCAGCASAPPPPARWTPARWARVASRAGHADASAPPRGLAADAGPPAPAAPCPSAPRTQGGAAAGPFPARRGSAQNSHRPPRQRPLGRRTARVPVAQAHRARPLAGRPSAQRGWRRARPCVRERTAPRLGGRRGPAGTGRARPQAGKPRRRA